MKHKKFYTLDINGNEIIRDLYEESNGFTYEKYYKGEYDVNNSIWHEMFDFYTYDSIGCDYERYGCYIKEGDIVLDIGANIGLFSYRAELQGASKVIAFEPLTPTFNCLVKNAGPKTVTYKNAVGNDDKFTEFVIHSSYDNIGGGSSHNLLNFSTKKSIIYKENVFVININKIFEVEKIDFLKIDTEGGELDILTEITDKNLSSLRCLASEFHILTDEYETFQENFINRMINLNFKFFILYHGDGKLRTLTFWKE